ncbi:tRNA(1-methyladenosine) methyltransferase, subunit GCD14, partial [Pseudoloma neurophilia]
WVKFFNTKYFIEKKNKDARNEQSIFTEQSVDIKKPHDTEDSIFTDKPHDTEDSICTEKTHDTNASICTDKPHDTNDSICTEKPHDTEDLILTQQPHDTEDSIFTEKPHDTKKLSNTEKHKIKIISKQNFVYILKPTPFFRQHRTAIINKPDISLIINLLDLNDQSIVLEAGYGSGVMNYYLRKTCKKVYSVELEESRIDPKLIENETVWIGDVADVRSIDYENIDQKNNKILHVPKLHAIFLDIPDASIVINNLNNLLKEDGRLCIYLISVQQILKTLEMLKKFGYRSDVYENVGREYRIIRKNDLRSAILKEGRMHTAYIIFARKSY